MRQIITLTAQEFVDQAEQADADHYRLEASGVDVTVSTELGDDCIIYELCGDKDGSLTVAGSGRGDAWRSGKGYGCVYRTDDGDGDAWRMGEGRGDARRTDDGDGDAYRASSGRGGAYRTGEGDGKAFSK